MGGGLSGNVRPAQRELNKMDAVWINDKTCSLIVDGKSYEIFVEPLERGRRYRVTVEGQTFDIDLKNVDGVGASLRPPCRSDGEAGGRPNLGGNRIGLPLHSPMPGRVIHIAVKVGDRVEEGMPLLTLSAMKMENELQAEGEGTVKEILVTVDDTVEAGQKLLVIQ